MFFLIDQAVSFPITFPANFQIPVNMNEALRQPMEFTQPKAEAVSAPTQVDLFTEGATNVEYAAV
jgi:hypothetical protein